MTISSFQSKTYLSIFYSLRALGLDIDHAYVVASRMSWGLVDRKLQKLNGLKN